MYRLRRLLALGAVLALVAACGNGGTSDTTTTAPGTTETTEDGGEMTTTVVEEEPSAVEGTLHLWVYLAEETDGPDFWEAFTEEFETRHPDASLEITEIASDTYSTKVAAAFAANEPPHVYAPNSGELINRYIRAGELAPLNDLTDLSVYAPGAYSPFSDEEGNVYGIPTFNYGIVMWYNADIFNENGLEIPVTWDELIAACDTLNANGITPIALGNRGGDAWTSSLLLDTIWYQYGGGSIGVDVTFDETRSWTDPTFVEAATQFQALIDANCFNPGFTGLDYSQMQALFFGGQAAMSFDGTWASVSMGPSGVEFEASAFGLPDAPGAVNSTASFDGIVGGVDGLAASRVGVEENPALVSAFFDLFGEKIHEWSEYGNFVSTAAEPRPVDDPILAALTEILSSAGEVVDITGILPTSVGHHYLQNIVSFTSGALTPEEFGQAMADAVEQERPNFEQ